jgi:hypothetical protein
MFTNEKKPKRHASLANQTRLCSLFEQLKAVSGAQWPIAEESWQPATGSIFQKM